MSTTAFQGDELLAQLQSDPFNENGGQMYSSEEDAKLHVEFFLEPVYQEFESKKTKDENGNEIQPRKIYKDTEYVKILIPGDKQTSIIRQVFPNDRQRWPQQYARFKQGLKDQIVGTPLSTFPHLDESKVKEYEFFNIRTIEQLADCPDGSQCGQAMRGFHEDKRKAQHFMDAAKGAAPVEDLKKQLAQRDELLEKMQARLEALEANKEEPKATAKAK